MKNLKWLILVVPLVAMGLAVPLVAQPACFHGIDLQKSATSPVEIGSPYEVAFLIENDELAEDTLMVTSLVDTVHASGGDTDSGNILASLTWTFTGTASMVGNNMVLPPGTSATSDPFSFYTVVEADFNLTNHTLPDTVAIKWQDLCDSVLECENCNNEPNQDATAPSQALVTAPLPCLNVEKTVDCPISMPGQTITHHITITNCGPGPLTKTAIFDTVSGIGDISITPPASCDALDAGQSCSFDVDFIVPDPFPGIGVENIVSAVYTDTFQQQVDANDSVSVAIIHPNFTVTKSCLTQDVPAGGSVIFDVNIVNTGDIALDFTSNEPGDGGLLASFSLDPGKNITDTVSVLSPGGDVFNQIIVEANLPDALCFQLPCNIVKEANDTCQGEVTGGATRTLGFWKTHCDYTEHILVEHCGGSLNLGWITLNDVNDVMGLLFANPANNSDKSKRCDTLTATNAAKCRIMPSKQAVAALLNSCLDNGASLPDVNIPGILRGTDCTAIKNLGDLLDDFNNSGDDIAIIDNDGELIGHATPRDCAAIANLKKVDCIVVNTTVRRHR